MGKELSAAVNRVTTTAADLMAAPHRSPTARRKTGWFPGAWSFYLLLGVILAAAMLALAASLAPWLYAAPVPVQLHLDAPAATQIMVGWDSQSNQLLPMVPVATPPGAVPNLWVAELPPRPSYRLTIVFQSAIQNAPLHGVTLIDVRNPTVPIFDRNATSASPWFESESVQSTMGQGAISLSGAAGSRIVLTDTVTLARHPNGFTTAAVWLCLIALVALGLALTLPLFRFRQIPALDSPGIENSTSVPSAALWVALAIATTLLVLILACAPIVLAGGDSCMYMLKAVALAQRGTTDLGGYEYELNRMPGFPFILSLIFRFLGYHLSTVALVQGLMFSASVMALALSLRKWMHPLIGAVAVLLSILSPAQVWAARTVLSESTFGTFSVLAMAAFFAHVGTKGLKSKLWLVIYALLVTIAIFIRPNGIALYMVFVPVVVPALVGLIIASRTLGERVLAIVRLAIPYILAIGVSVVAILAWSARNDARRGYFGASDMTGVTLVCGLVASGTFDSHCLAGTDLYDSYLTHKYQQGYYYPGFFIRHDLYMRMTHDQQVCTNQTLTDLDNSLRKLAAKSKRISPWQVNTVGWLRSMSWALLWPDVEAYSKEGIRLDYVTFENTGAVRRGTPSPSAQELRATFLPFVSSKLIYDDRSPNPVYSVFAAYGELYYNGWYIAWSALALMGAVYVLWNDQPALAAPLFVFVGNILLNVYLLNVFSRYIHILDVLLFFQCGLGLSLLIRKRIARKSRWLSSQPLAMNGLDTVEKG